MEAKSLRELAEKIIDGEVTGNQDQIVMNWARNKYKDTILKDKLFERGLTAVRNFDTTKQKVLRERHRAERLRKEAVRQKRKAVEKAAPDLLEALKTIYGMCDCITSDIEIRVRNIAREVINKTGK